MWEILGAWEEKYQFSTIRLLLLNITQVFKNDSAQKWLTERLICIMILVKVSLPLTPCNGHQIYKCKSKELELEPGTLGSPLQSNYLAINVNLVGCQPTGGRNLWPNLCYTSLTYRCPAAPMPKPENIRLNCGQTHISKMMFFLNIFIYHSWFEDENITNRKCLISGTSFVLLICR